MSKRIVLLGVAVLATATFTVGVVTALAGTPWGTGDDTGFYPPDSLTNKCEASVAKNSAKFADGVIKCHIKAADSAFKNKPFDEELCETTLRTKIDAANAKLLLKPGCPSCLDSAGEMGAILSYAQAQLDATNGVFFCGGSTPLGGDDSGFVPSTADMNKCEQTVAKNVSKLSAAIVKCHIKAADSFVKVKPFDEELCESTAQGKFDIALTKLGASGICPPCNTVIFPSLGASVVGQVDVNNGTTWCASTSGAFVD